MKLKIHRENIIFKLETSIGDLSVFEINFNDENKLTQELACKFSDADPIEAIKQLFRLVSFPPKDLIDGKYKPQKTVLQKEDIEKLLIEEIEKFAKKIVEKDKSLSDMVSQEEIAKKNDAINQGSSDHNKNIKKEQIKHGETYIEFSHRLISRYFKENRDRIETQQNKFFKGLGYPNPLLKELEKQVSMSDSFIKEAQKYANMHDSFIKEAQKHAIPEWANYKGPNIDSVYSSTVPEPFFPKAPSPEIPDFNTYLPETLGEILERTSKPLYKNLEKLNRSIVESKGFMGETYKTMVQVAGILKDSSDSNKKFSILSLSASVLVLILTIYTIWTSNQSSKDITKALQLNTKAVTEKAVSLSEGLDMINYSLLNSFETNKALIIQLEKNINQNKENTNHELLKLFQKQNDLLTNINDALEKMPKRLKKLSPINNGAKLSAPNDDEKNN